MILAQRPSWALRIALAALLASATSTALPPPPGAANVAAVRQLPAKTFFRLTHALPKAFAPASAITRVARYGSGFKNSVKELFTRKFGGFSRAYTTAQTLSDQRLQKMPDEARANLAGALLKPGLLTGRATREGASQQFVRVLTAHGEEPGHILSVLSRLGYHDPSKLEKRLAGPAKAEFSRLMAKTQAKPGDWDAFHAFADTATHTQARRGSEVDLLIDGKRYYAAMGSAIERAQRYVLLEKYMVHGDGVGRELVQQLKVASERGVHTQAIYDRTGSSETSPKLFDEMKRAGVRALGHASQRILGGLLDHRKLMVVDGKEGYIGGMNVGNEYRDVWHDVQSRVSGPAVADMAGLVAKQIKANGGKLPRSIRKQINRSLREVDAPPPGAANNHTVRVVAHEGMVDQHQKLLYLRAIDTATQRILLENPYFSDSDVVGRLAAAARRGVDVRLVIPMKNESDLLKVAARAHYRELLSAGVRVYEYFGKNPEKPVMTHGKVALFDDEIATIGSSNLDARSLVNNHEANIWTRNASLNMNLRKNLFERDFRNSHEVRAYRPNPWQKAQDGTTKAISGLL